MGRTPLGRAPVGRMEDVPDGDVKKGKGGSVEHEIRAGPSRDICRSG